jgi:hypothetical protein
MQLDDVNEQLLMSLDVTPISCETPTTTNSLFAAILPRINQHELTESTPRRYNLRRNSDFPRSSIHASRTSEFLQVPLSSSQHRLTDHNQQSVPKLPRVRDIREASMDQIIFRVIDPVLSSVQRPTEPIINISSFDDATTTSSVVRPNSVDTNESSSSTTIQPTSATPVLRELRPYSRSKTAPLSSPSGAQQFQSPKQCEARDLCGSSSKDDPLSTTGH